MEEKITNTMIQEIAADLEGSGFYATDLETLLEERGFSTDDMTDSNWEDLDMLVMECPACGWVYKTSELEYHAESGQDLCAVCIDLYEDEEDNWLTDGEDYED